MYGSLAAWVSGKEENTISKSSLQDKLNEVGGSKKIKKSLTESTQIPAWPSRTGLNEADCRINPKKGSNGIAQPEDTETKVSNLNL